MEKEVVQIDRQNSMHFRSSQSLVKKHNETSGTSPLFMERESYNLYLNPEIIVFNCEN